MRGESNQIEAPSTEPSKNAERRFDLITRHTHSPKQRVQSYPQDPKPNRHPDNIPHSSPTLQHRLTRLRGIVLHRDAPPGTVLQGQAHGHRHTRPMAVPTRPGTDIAPPPHRVLVGQAYPNTSEPHLASDPLSPEWPASRGRDRQSAPTRGSKARAANRGLARQRSGHPLPRLPQPGLGLRSCHLAAWVWPNDWRISCRPSSPQTILPTPLSLHRSSMSGFGRGRRIYLCRGTAQRPYGLHMWGKELPVLTTGQGLPAAANLEQSILFAQQLILRRLDAQRSQR
jgi:hypothetical protein